MCLAFPHKMQQAHNTFWRGARRNMVLTPSKQPIHWPMTADLTTASKYKIFIYSWFSLYWTYGLFTLFISFDVQCTWPPILLNDFTAFCDELEEMIESHGTGVYSSTFKWSDLFRARPIKNSENLIQEDRDLSFSINARGKFRYFFLQIIS